MTNSAAERSYSERPRTTRDAELCRGRREILAGISMSIGNFFRSAASSPRAPTSTAWWPSSTGGGERPRRQIDGHRARALCHPGPPSSCAADTAGFRDRL